MEEIEHHFRDDRRSYVKAAAAVARLDESLKINRETGTGSITLPRTLRKEAISIARMEGSVVRQESLSRLLGDPHLTGVERGTRIAADIYSALQSVNAWSVEAPDQAEIVSVFEQADTSSGRLKRTDVLWSLEEDAQWLSDTLATLCETPEPWMAAETTRLIWTSGRFFGTSRRMAMIVSSWVIKIGCACEENVFGLAGEIAKDPDGFRDAAQIKDDWSVLFAETLASAAIAQKTEITDAMAERTALRALCPPGRASSSVHAAIDYIFTNPVFTAKQFAEGLGLTSRGAKVVLDRLVDTNIIDPDGGARNRKFTCRRLM